MVAWIMAILLGVSIGIVIDRACEWLSEDTSKNDKKSELNSKYGYIDTDMVNEYRNITDIDITHMYPEIKKINKSEDKNDEN